MDGEKHSVEWYSGYLCRMSEEMKRAIEDYDSLITEIKITERIQKMISYILAVNAALMISLLLLQLLR